MVALESDPRDLSPGPPPTAAAAEKNPRCRRHALRDGRPRNRCRPHLFRRRRLRDASGARIYVNWRALEGSGIAKDTPVILRTAATTTLAKTTRSLLDQAQATRTGSRLDFAEDEGVLVISTYNDLAKNVVTRVYDVRDLIDSNRIPNIDPPSNRFPHPSRHWPIDNLFRSDLPYPGAANNLLALSGEIERNIDPKSWRNAGGTLGSTRVINGMILVTQTEENQVDVTYFLARRRWLDGAAVFVARTLALMIPALTVVTAALIFYRWRQGRLTLNKGRCPSCGYDLRATPQRCPECGFERPVGVA